MNLPVVNVRWSTPIPCDGADAAPIPARSGVYEILRRDESGVERMFIAQTADLRRAFVSHIAGTAGDEALRRGMLKEPTAFRYWDCVSESRRREVVAALVDMHCYEWGHEDVGDVGCVNVSELE